MEINGITYSHDGRTFHLKDVTGKIEKHKITTIIGPNGSGKSTLLGVLAKNYLPHKGEVILDGKQLNQYRPKDFAKKVGVVHQQNSAPADMTVEKLISFGRIPYRSFFSNETEEDKQAIERALQQTKLLDKRHKSVSELSGGERQRVWIAMTLAQQTPYLFLDEPTTFLDIYYQYEILELVKQLNQEHGLTIVMVLHDMNQAIRYSDKILVMKNGHLIAEGDPKTVITEELIQDVYGIKMLIKEDEAGLYTIPVGI